MPYADKFVILDNVSFSKGFYLDRTKYVSHDGETKWLSMPIGNQTKKNINSILIEDKIFVDNFIKTLYNSYNKADYFKKEWDGIEKIIHLTFEKHSNLVDINIELIKGIGNVISLELPELIKSSQFGNYENKTERLINICKKIKAKSIIIGDGASLKVHDWDKIIENGIQVKIQNFYGKHPHYKQIRRQRLKFAPGVSIIDCIFNIGSEETLKLIKSIKYKPLILRNNE